MTKTGATLGLLSAWKKDIAMWEGTVKKAKEQIAAGALCVAIYQIAVGSAKASTKVASFKNAKALLATVGIKPHLTRMARFQATLEELTAAAKLESATNSAARAKAKASK